MMNPTTMTSYCGVDFLNYLYPDASLKILMYLCDPSDLVRVSCVSRAWRRFVIENGLCKQLCLKMFPQMKRVDAVTEPSLGWPMEWEAGSSEHIEWKTLEREHRAYAFVARGFTSFPLRACISYAISASSTDNYPEESIFNTLEARDKVGNRASYWSSKGQSNVAVPEMLTYKLVSDICIVTEINIQPFQAYFQWGFPIYSAMFVRFRMGHSKVPMDDPMGDLIDHCAGDQFEWTYTSPKFPMAQENQLQNFKLPQPALCIGGILQIELLGRVQRQEMDGLYYMCMSHVQVVGRPLSPAFDVEITGPSGKFLLKTNSYHPPSSPEERIRLPTSYLREHIQNLDEILNLLRGQGVVFEEHDLEVGEDVFMEDVAN